MILVEAFLFLQKNTMSEDHDIRKFIDFATKITKYGGSPLSTNNQNSNDSNENPYVWKKSLEWSIQSICSILTETKGVDCHNTNNETVLCATSTVAVACELLRKLQTHQLNYVEEEEPSSRIMWSISLLLLLMTNDSYDKCKVKIIESFLCRLVSHYCSQCYTQQDQISAAVLLSNNIQLSYQLKILTLMAQDWKPHNTATTYITLSQSWIRLSVFPIVSTSLSTSINYLRSISSHDNYHNNLSSLDEKSVHELELGIMSVSCYTAWLQCQVFYESLTSHPINFNKSSSVDATMVPFLIFQLAQECLRVSSCLISSSNSTYGQTFPSSMSKLLSILLECIMEEISIMTMSIYYTHINELLISLIMDTYSVLSPKSFQNQYGTQQEQKFELMELYDTMVEFSVTLAIAIFEKNKNNSVKEQHNFEFIDIFLWGISHPKLLETVTIPAVDLLPQVLEPYYGSDNISIQMEKCIRAIVQKQVPILKEEMKNEHMEYFLESSKDTITTISSKQQHMILQLLKRELQYQIQNIEKSNSQENNNYNAWAVLTCIDFITQVISSSSVDIFYVHDKSITSNNQQHEFPENWKSLFQACEPYMDMLDNRIGYAVTRLIQHLGSLLFISQNRNSSDFRECKGNDVKVETPHHALNLLKYFHELAYTLIPSSKTNGYDSICMYSNCSFYDDSKILLLQQLCRAMKEISVSCTNSEFYKQQYEWEPTDTLHPFNAIVEMVAKYIFCLRENYIPDLNRKSGLDYHKKCLLFLVYAGTNYATNAFVKEERIYNSETIFHLLCSRCVLPLIQHYGIDIYEGQGSCNCVHILLQVFGALSMSTVTSNSASSSIVTLFQSLEQPLNQVFFQQNSNSPSEYLSDRATLALLVAQCCGRSIKDQNSILDSAKEKNDLYIYDEIFSRCLNIVNDSMNCIIKNSDGIVLTRFVEALNNSIEAIYNTNDVDGKLDNPRIISLNHKMTFLLILDQLFDLVTRVLEESVASEEVMNEEKESWIISLVETCLLAGRATFRTEIMTERPQTFSKLTFLCLHILAQSIPWDENNFDEEGRLYKASLDCLKWSFWCSRPYEKTKKQQQDILLCMNMAFGNIDTIQRILYIFCSKSLGITSNGQFYEDFPNKQQKYSRVKLQRSFTTCLHIVLFGDDRSIHPDLVNIFRGNSECLKYAIYDCTGRKGDRAIVDWIYEGIVTSNKGIQSMRRFLLSARKVLNGSASLEHAKLKQGNTINYL